MVSPPKFFFGNTNKYHNRSLKATTFSAEKKRFFQGTPHPLFFGLCGANFALGANHFWFHFPVFSFIHSMNFSLGMTIREPMLMVNKEAQQKQDKDSSPAAIPKQGEIENKIDRI